MRIFSPGNGGGTLRAMTRPWSFSGGCLLQGIVDGPRYSRRAFVFIHENRVRSAKSKMKARGSLRLPKGLAQRPHPSPTDDGDCDD
jgi:hypothetical protein